MFQIFLIIFLNYFIVDVVDVTQESRRYAPTNLASTRANTSVGIKVKRVDTLASHRDALVNEIRKKKYLLQKRSDHANEMIKKYNKRPIFCENIPPIFYSTDVFRYAFLNQGYYATLYDIQERVPVYSAYTLKSEIQIPGRYGPWETNSGLLLTEQPLPDDFIGISKRNLDKGHLYPQWYAAADTEMKKYTNIITNMALQYANFNRNTWKRLELALRNASIYHCKNLGSEIYFLTGVIPSKPIPANYVNYTNIPDYFWTTACCQTSNQHINTGWSFAYIVQNNNSNSLNVDMYFVEDFLQTSHMAGRFSQLFFNSGVDMGCLVNPSKTVEVIRTITTRNTKDIFSMHGKLLESLNQYQRF